MEEKRVEYKAKIKDELGRRLLTYESKPPIRTPQDVADMFMPELRYLKKKHGADIKQK